MPVVPALRQGRDRLERPAAERLARDAAGEAATSKAIREGSTKRVLRHARGAGRRTSREKYADVLEGVRRGAEGRHRRGLRQPGRASPSCCASPRTAVGADEPDVSLADYVARMKEGQDKIYYLLAAGAGRAPRQPAPGDLPQEGHRGAAADRAASTAGWWPTCPSSTASGCSRSPRARPTSAGWQDEAEKQAQEQASTEFAGLTGKLKEIARRGGVRRADHEPADQLAGVHRGQRAGHRHEPGPAAARLGRCRASRCWRSTRSTR